MGFACLSLFFLGETENTDIVVLHPSSEDSLAYDQNRIFIISTVKSDDNAIFVSMPWCMEKMISVLSKEEKENFPKNFYRLFPPHSSMRTLVYSFRYFSGYTLPETLSYALADTMSIRAFWQEQTFLSIAGKAQSKDVSAIIFKITGWKDSLVASICDDPTNDTRALYKMTIPLIAGNNSIYFSSDVSKLHTTEFRMNYLNESSSLSAREIKFHNSMLVQNCTGCHEGMPNDDDTTMSADCSSCHKVPETTENVHLPFSSKDCTSCHSWSSEKHSVVVTDDVPQKCYECHDEKKSAVEESSVPHPVAGECITCHSPHRSAEKKLLKQNIYSLCTNCHEAYTINHPVGRHPLQYATFGTEKKEISCVSCHTPHGSANESLLTSSGGKMAICIDCH
jgi:predicted CXXCH cytochrome family protein